MALRGCLALLRCLHWRRPLGDPHLPWLLAGPRDHAAVDLGELPGQGWPLRCPQGFPAPLTVPLTLLVDNLDPWLVTSQDHPARTARTFPSAHRWLIPDTHRSGLATRGFAPPSLPLAAPSGS